MTIPAAVHAPAAGFCFFTAVLTHVTFETEGRRLGMMQIAKHAVVEREGKRDTERGVWLSMERVVERG